MLSPHLPPTRDPLSYLVLSRGNIVSADSEVQRVSCNRAPTPSCSDPGQPFCEIADDHTLHMKCTGLSLGTVARIRVRAPATLQVASKAPPALAEM